MNEPEIKKVTFKSVIDIFKTAFQGFLDDKITKLSASLSYATMFSIAPFFIVLITIAGYFLGKPAAEGELYGKLQSLLGSELAVKLQDLVKNAAFKDKSFWSTITSVVIVILGATSVFAELQDSLNIIWGIKPKPKRGWLQIIKNRVLSFSIIISIGFIMLVSFVVNYTMQDLNDRLVFFYPDVAVIFFTILTFLIKALITVATFALIFKMLPDAKIKFKDVLVGAFATTILFLIGQNLISLYIEYSNPGSAYGKASFVIVIMLWVYFASLILYFGAEFTKAWAVKLGGNIYPEDYAVATEIIEVEKDKKVKAINKKKIDTDGEVNKNNIDTPSHTSESPFNLKTKKEE